MKTSRSFKFIAALMALTLAVLACGGGGTTTKPTRTPPPPTEEEEEPTEVVTTDEDLEIVNQSTYLDSYDYFHVVGEIRNNGRKALTDIELTIEIKNEDGDSLLKDDSDDPVDSLTFSPLLNTLGPDESSPFDYYLSIDPEAESETPAEDDCCQVTVTGQETGEVDRADLTVENGQMTTDSFDTIHIVGELVNQGDTPVQINSLAGAALNGDKEVVAADWTGLVTRYLAPSGNESGSNRTPFHVTLDGPVEDVDDWLVYFDADQTDPAAGTGLELEIARGFFDSLGTYHLVGTLTNNGDEMLNVSLVAGLYADDNTVVDADTLSVPIYVDVGQTLPYDFQYFSSVNNNQDEADRIDNFTVQVDHYWTYPTTSEVLELETANEENEFTEGSWSLKGDVTNSSDQELSSLIVLAGLYDADENLLAVNWTYVYPPEGEEAIAAEETTAFDLTVYLDPDLDTAELTFKTFAQGYVKD